MRIVVTPDGSEIFITRRGTPGYVFYYNFDTYASDDITVGLIDDEYGIAITPDGRTVYAVCADSTIWPINVESHEALIHIDCPERVWVIAITPDGTTGYVTTFSGDHTYALNLSSNEFSDPIALGSSSLYDIAITPDQAPTALFTSVINGLTVTFDASTSTSPVGDVVEWNWDFGDGDHETSTTPTISHTYEGTGTFTVTLTVVNTAGTGTEETKTFTGQTVSNNGGPSARSIQEISIESPPAPSAPPTFTGKSKITSKKHSISLKTKWKASPSSDVLLYEIFARNKKIETISIGHPRHKTIHLHPHYIHHHLSKKYRHYLNSKYQVRAVGPGGVVSPFTPLRVVR